MGGMEGGGKGKKRGATVWSPLPFCYVLKSTMNGGFFVEASVMKAKAPM